MRISKWSEKQKESIREAKARWNFQIGAVRSGKSFIDISLKIKWRIQERIGKPGIAVILGVSKSTIERNVLEPMREIFGKDRVGKINSENKALLFGEEVYCLGAEKVSQVAKIQGASIKYCYGDEVAKWNKEVFQMLKSRLDKSYSCFDGTLNPESPDHWLKEFLDDESLDIYIQHYTIFDNPFLDANFVENLVKEYAGTVYYDRYILGQWKRAEGIIYRKFADNPEEYIVDKLPDIFLKINIGVDFGGNGSWHTFVATGFTLGYIPYILDSVKIPGSTTPEELETKFIEFYKMIYIKYGNKLPKGANAINVYCDSAEQVLINGIKIRVVKERLGVAIHNARKSEIKERMRLIIRLFGLKNIFINRSAKTVISSFQKAVYSDKPGHMDERLDNEETNRDGTIDTLDATEYSIEPEFGQLKHMLEKVK